MQHDAIACDISAYPPDLCYNVPMMTCQEEIQQNLSLVRARIDAACARAGRDPGAVTLLAVSKTKPNEAIEAAIASGQTVFGENYVQEIVAKYEYFNIADRSLDAAAARASMLSPAPDPSDDIRLPIWHMIGHLQRNKVKYIIDKVQLIHSVDSLPLALQIEKEAAKKDLTAEVLLEVNIAEEDTKWGFSASETIDAARQIGALPHVHVRGLMTSAPYTEAPESNRPHFRALKRLADDLTAARIPGADGRILSMGMTGDFEVAVEEGATIVRVGTAIFGARDYQSAPSLL